jgi:hypothetical protein
LTGGDAVGDRLFGDGFGYHQTHTAGIGDGRQEPGVLVHAGRERDASALAAAMIMASVTRRARETRMPRARPGKI